MSCHLTSSNCLKYACQKNMPNERVDALSGSSIVVQKGPADCNNLGPVTAGFNQAACGMFYDVMNVLRFLNFLLMTVLSFLST